MSDPELERPIEAPWPYRRRKLARTWQLFVWMAAALGVLVSQWGTPTPPMAAICTLMGLVPILLLPAIKPLFANIREIKAARRAKPLNRLAIAHIQNGEGAAAVEALRTALAIPNIGPPARAGLVYNLGIAVFMVENYDLGQALIAHARASGWLDTWRYRNAISWPPRTM